MLNTLKEGSTLPDHRLVLKNGFVAILLRNIDLLNGHINAARYIVEEKE